MALLIFPWETNHLECKSKILIVVYNVLRYRLTYLADSGTSQGVRSEIINGADVTRHRVLQSATAIAIQGRMQAAKVKNIAMDMLATKVRHFGPTYSNTIVKI